MPLVVSVPLNTMLADLDETLRSLLKRELGRHGFDGVEIAFDAPARDWSGQLSSPTVNLFLYDLRESHEGRPNEWLQRRRLQRSRARDPPADADGVLVRGDRLDAGRRGRAPAAVTGARGAVRLPGAARRRDAGATAGARRPLPDRRADRRSRRRTGKADFWNAVGGQYKASLDFVTTIACESGSAFERGPEVRTQTIAVRQADGPRTITEMHRIGGTVARKDGEPAAGAWVAIPTLGLLATAGDDGRFRFDRVPPGRHEIEVRAPDGGAAKAAGRRARRPGRPGPEVEMTERATPGARTTLALAGRRAAKVGACPSTRFDRRASLLGNLEPIVRLGMATVLG